MAAATETEYGGSARAVSDSEGGGVGGFGFWMAAVARTATVLNAAVCAAANRLPFPSAVDIAAAIPDAADGNGRRLAAA